MVGSKKRSDLNLIYYLPYNTSQRYVFRVGFNIGLVQLLSSLNQVLSSVACITQKRGGGGGEGQVFPNRKTHFPSLIMNNGGQLSMKS